MEDRYYALIEVASALTAGQKGKLVSALRKMGRQTDALPCRATHLRPRLDGQAALVEFTLEPGVTKADVVDALASDLGIAKATLTSNLSLTVFAGRDPLERATSARDYLTAHAAAWEPDDA